MGPRFRLGRPTKLARKLRSEPTDAERKLWQYLCGSQTGLKFSRQLPIAGHICDFVCRSARLIVEVDGGQHGWRVEQDAARTAALEEAGYRILRFWNNEVLGNIEAVVARIIEVAPTPQLPRASGRGSK